jgi:hypothetical protein
MSPGLPRTTPGRRQGIAILTTVLDRPVPPGVPLFPALLHHAMVKENSAMLAGEVRSSKRKGNFLTTLSTHQNQRLP